MVAKITFPATVERALNYNEQKVKKGAAECLSAHGFLKEAKRLNFSEKLARFAWLNALNKRTKTNTIHVSLNFHPDEKLDKDVLLKIAASYMEKLGFGEQPYLVYRHTDAGHPHLHIVTTNIQKNGKRIPTHNIGRDRSAKARKEIETDFELKKAEESKPKAKADLRSISAQRVHYGSQPTKQAITDIVDHVLSDYAFTSLPELNAVLGLYNVTAERGAANSVRGRTGGLLYRLLDENKRPVGVPIKASSIEGKPTLSFLEEKFKRNEPIKTRLKKGVQTRLAWALLKNPTSLLAFQQSLERDRMALVVRQNEQGIVYGLTYVDHTTKSVFNGSELGKAYSAAAVLKKATLAPSVSDNMTRKDQEATTGKDSQQTGLRNGLSRHENELGIITELLDPVASLETFPILPKKAKRKKRKRL